MGEHEQTVNSGKTGRIGKAEDMFREDNHIVRAWGSEFADMVNTLLHPVPNRNIEDFEGEMDHERKD